MEWQRLGTVAPRELVPARVQAHWAAQVLAAAGETWLPPTPDTGHTAMTWDASREALLGRELPGAGCRVGLRVAELTLFVADAELALAGRTLREAYAWTSQALKAHTRGALARELVHPGFELDPHPLAQGARFERDAGLAELARWYANAAAVLERFARATPGAGEVRCWPHHFDIATLVTLETDRSIGVGLEPGDGFIAEPYWYVTHSPVAEREALPPLPAGEWFSGFPGAVLRAGELVAAGDASAQARRVEAFLDAAVPANRALALAAPL